MQSASFASMGSPVRIRLPPLKKVIANAVTFFRSGSRLRLIPLGLRPVPQGTCRPPLRSGRCLHISDFYEISDIPTRRLMAPSALRASRVPPRSGVRIAAAGRNPTTSARWSSLFAFFCWSPACFGPSTSIFGSFLTVTRPFWSIDQHFWPCFAGHFPGAGGLLPLNPYCRTFY